MLLAHLIEQYGYLAIIVGTFLEGETILVIGAYAAHRGYLSLSWVIVCAFGGSLCGDQLAFLLGRRFGRRWLLARKNLQARAERVRIMLHKNATLLMLGFRFLYGLRNVTPLTLGASGMPPRRFVPLNIAGAAIWAVSVACAGYAFGEGISGVFKRAHRYEAIIMLLLLAFGLTLSALGMLKRHLKRRRSGQS